MCLADIDVAEGDIVTSTLAKQYGEDRVMFVKCDVTILQDVKGS